MPISLRTDNDGDLSIDRKNDMMFILTEAPNLMFYQFKEHAGPQAVILPFGETLNVHEKYHKSLKKMDGVSVEEWMETSKNADKIFAEAAEDSDSVRNNKDSMKRWYNFEDRF